MMTVEELMDQLQKYPPYYRVCIETITSKKYLDRVDLGTDGFGPVVEMYSNVQRIDHAHP